MTIAHADQFAWVNDAAQRDRVEAGAAGAALTYLLGGFAPNSDPTKQAQRNDLIADILVRQQYQTTFFGWLIITGGSLTTRADVTDSTIITAIEGWFDIVAELVHRTP